MSNAEARLKLANWMKGTPETIEKIGKETLLEIGKRLINRSAVGNPATWHPPRWPKGYIPGHFINNWQLGIDSVPTGVIAGSDPTGAASTERLSQFGDKVIGHKFYFVNNVPYARILEDGGHSPQVPPQGMVGLTSIEFPQIVEEAERNVNSKN
jgi:hypothetical protein